MNDWYQRFHRWNTYQGVHRRRRNHLALRNVPFGYGEEPWTPNVEVEEPYIPERVEDLPLRDAEIILHENGIPWGRIFQIAASMGAGYVIRMAQTKLDKWAKSKRLASYETESDYQMDKKGNRIYRLKTDGAKILEEAYKIKEAQKHEFKIHSCILTNSTVASPTEDLLATCLNNVPRGSSHHERIGQKIIMKSLHLNINVYMEPIFEDPDYNVPPQKFSSIHIVVWKTEDAWNAARWWLDYTDAHPWALLNNTDVEYTSINSLYVSPKVRKRNIVLWRETINLDSNTKPLVCIKKFIKLKNWTAIWRGDSTYMNCGTIMLGVCKNMKSGITLSAYKYPAKISYQTKLVYTD